MQLGTRWTAGGEPPASLPEALRRQIAAVEAVMPADQLGQPAPRWTLTWLEGRPIADPRPKGDTTAFAKAAVP